MLRALGFPVFNTHWMADDKSRWFVTLIDKSHADNYFKFHPLSNRLPLNIKVSDWLRDNGIEHFILMSDAVGFADEDDAILFALAFV